MKSSGHFSRRSLVVVRLLGIVVGVILLLASVAYIAHGQVPFLPGPHRWAQTGPAFILGSYSALAFSLSVLLIAISRTTWGGVILGTSLPFWSVAVLVQIHNAGLL